jgi:hypothetical protein
MKWFEFIKPWTVRKAQGEDPRMFGPGEDPTKFGTPAVNISDGEPSKVFSIPGVEGSINLNIGIEEVKNALERVFGSSYFFPITDIKVRPMPGKFGETSSREPHTIFINEAAMLDAIKQAVANEAQKAAQSGIKAKFTPEIGAKIEREIAKLLWETIPHERQHALDFQSELHKIFSGQRGNVSGVPESHGEQAGKAALGRFSWYGA